MRIKESSMNNGFSKKDLFICVFLILAISITYFKVKNNSFIDFDDPDYVTDNTNVQKGLTMETLKWSFQFTKKYDHTYWHPITWISHMTDCQLFGLNPKAHHLMNLFFHILNSLLVFLIFRKATGQKWKSAFAAAIFALHPINVDSVAWIAERKNLLSTFFFLLTILFYIYFIIKRTFIRYFLIFVSMLLGLMAKPMLVTLPCVLLLMDLWPLERIKFKSLTENFHLFFEKIPLFLLSLIWVKISMLSISRIGLQVPSMVTPISLRIANAVVSYIRYIEKLFWPDNLAIFYPYPVKMMPLWQPLLSFTLLMFISVMVIKSIKKKPWLAMGWFWYLGTMVPVTGIMQNGLWPALADRWAYMPFLGLYIIISWGGFEICRKLKLGNKISLCLALLIIFCMGFRTSLQLNYWKNNMTLFQHALDVTKNNFVAHNNLGNYLNKHGKIKESIKQYNMALKIFPGLDKAHLNLGMIYLKENNPYMAMNHLLKALDSSPESADIHKALGTALFKAGRYNQARKHLSKAIDINPNDYSSHNQLGNTLKKLEKLDLAKTEYTIAIKLRPERAEAYNNMANLMVKQGKLNSAIQYFNKALRIKPKSAPIHDNIGTALILDQKIKDAIKQYQKAVDLRPESTKFRNDLVSALFKQGSLMEKNNKIDIAIENYEKSLKIRSDFIPSINALAGAWIKKGNYEKSADLYQKLIDIYPDKSYNYYNMACVFAKRNQLNYSIKWLKMAIKKGYRNFELLKTDPDLEPIRHLHEYRLLINGK